MFNAGNSTQLLIGKSAAATATQALDLTTATPMVDGDIVVLDQNDAVMAAGTTYSTSPSIRVVQCSTAGGVGSVIIQSDRIDGANVISFTGKDFDASQEQIWRLGFNGVTGSVIDTGSLGQDDYVLRLTFNEDKNQWSQYSNTRIFRYEPDTTNTEEEVAASFATQISADSFSKTEVTVERLADQLSVGGGDAGITWTFTNGSKTATRSAAGVLVAGDYVRRIVIGSDAITVPVYKIASVESATSVTLDQPYQSASGTVLAPGYFTAATAATTNFGLEFTGLAQTFTVGKFKYVKVKFNITTSGFGSTNLTKAQESSRGNGEGQEISELEWFTYGFEGAVDRFSDSSPTIKADA
ncbi:MAG: hypothetical protein NUV80_04985, partial [Candidatus Berkelbacteria bacterium]|nr:hypothetical protein [Candidatus Berkelbacteria bacterium]